MIVLLLTLTVIAGLGLGVLALGHALTPWLSCWLLLGGRSLLRCLGATLRVYLYIGFFSLCYGGLFILFSLSPLIALVLLLAFAPLLLVLASSSLARSLHCSGWQGLLLLLVSSLIYGLLMHPLGPHQLLQEQWQNLQMHHGPMI